MTSQAEALVSFPGHAAPAALKLLELRQGIQFEARPGRVRILAVSDGAGIEAITAATLAALALIDALKDDAAMIENVRLVDGDAAARAPERQFVSRGFLDKGKAARPRPQTLMGEVTAPRAAPDNRREAFRQFMTANRLRPTSWAKDAGVAPGEILGFLTGRSRGFSGEVAEKLARAAKVRVEDMFK